MENKLLKRIILLIPLFSIRSFYQSLWTFISWRIWHFFVTLFFLPFYSLADEGYTSYNLEFLPYDLFLSEMNPFQEDCLNTLQPPTLFLKRVELQKTKMKSVYLIRLVGEIKDTESVDFSKKYIKFIDSKNNEEIFKFSGDQFSFNKAVDGNIVLSFLSPGDRKIQLPLVFHQKIDHFFDLNIELSSEGKISKAILIPNLDFDKRKNLCAKSRFWMSGGIVNGFQQQTLTNLNGELQGVSSGHILKAEYVNSKTQIKSYIFQTEVKSAEISLPEINLMRSRLDRVTDISLRSYSQHRFINQQFPLLGAVSSPFFRYGMGGDILNLWKLDKADSIQMSRSISLQGLFGVGIEFYGQKKWAGELSLGSKIQLLSDRDLSHLMGIDLRAQFFYAPQWNWIKSSFIGIDSQIKYLNSTYRRSESIDKSGQFQQKQIEVGIVFGKIF